jgi:hypothetical protein
MKFEQLLKKQKENTKSLIEAAKKESEGSGYLPDDRFWRPLLDKAGNGYAIIRFLPAPDVEIPWVKYFTHGFKSDGGWFIENCPTSIGQQCPACESNSVLWKSGLESDKDIARSRKRRLHYVSNILVVKDRANPENEGKVFLYKYGTKLFEKIKDVMEPVFDDQEPIDPFNLFSGANFKLKIKQVISKDGKYWNYDSSEFESSSELYDGDETQLEKMFNNLYKIGEFVDPKNYKSHEELKTRLNSVLGEKENNVTSKYRSEPSPLENTEETQTTTTSGVSNKSSKNDDEDDDDMEYFRKLAAEDDDIPF